VNRDRVLYWRERADINIMCAMRLSRRWDDAF
jgi:hypothetical protein